MIENLRGNIIIDGPNIKIDNKGCATTIFCSREFIMKSGKLDIKHNPRIIESENETSFQYGEVIKAFDKVDILGGKININYVYPRGDYPNIVLKGEGAAICIAGNKPNFVVNPVLNLPEELKDQIKLTYDYKIRFFISENGTVADPVIEIEDPSSIEGLTWDKENKILIMDGFKKYRLSIESEYSYENITIIVKNNNGVSELSMENISAVFKGEGVLRMWNMEVGFSSFLYWTNDKYTLNYCDLTLDGPYLEMEYHNLHVGKLKIKSGVLDIYHTSNYTSGAIAYPRYIYCNKGIDVTGGKIIIRNEVYPKGYTNFSEKDTAPSFWLEKNADGKAEVNLSNCKIIVIDPTSVFKDNLFGYVQSKEYDNKVEYPKFVQNGNVSMVTYKNEDGIIKTDINDFVINVSDTPCIYNGKNQMPKVKVGDLYEGIDYTVEYYNNIEVGKASVKITGIGFYCGEKTVEFEIIPKRNLEEKENISGNDKKEKNSKINSNLEKTFIYKKYIYRIIIKPSANAKYGKVEVVGLVNKNLKKAKIKNTVAFAGKKYKVTSIAKNAFKNNKKIKSVVIGKNVTKIGSKAFYNCKKLKKVVIKSKKLKLGKKVFAEKGGKKIKISVPKKLKKKYKKLFKKYKNIVVK